MDLFDSKSSNSFGMEDNQGNRNYTVISDWFDNESIKDLMDRN